MPRRPAAALGLLASALWRRVRPETRGGAPRFIRREGLEHEIRIWRDECGVAHVRAETLADLAFGQGLAMAQDRLFQMDILRRLAAGRLAEMLGDRPVDGVDLSLRGGSLLAVDELYRSLRMVPVAREELAAASPDARAVGEGFAAGVNAWLRDCRPRELPPEHLLLGVDPAPWQPEDSLAIAKLVGWLLGLAFVAKPLLGRLAANPRLRCLLPPDLAHATCVVSDARLPDAARLDLLARAALGLAGPGTGSNNWVVSGSRTASGKPLLCNDPHLVFGLPALWYPVALLGPFRAIGASLPGIPLVLLGRNDALAWGFTAVMADEGDYYRETLDGAGRYRRGETWHAVEEVPETFRLPRKAPDVRRLRYVRHSGILCPLLPAEPGEPPLSFRWVGMEAWRGLDAVLAMNRARDLAEFERGVRDYAAPAQNVVAADRAGNVGYFCAGKFPRRPWAGAGPVILDGTNPEHAWQGYLAWEEHPRCLNPQAGFIASANNRTAASLPRTIAASFWEPPYRATRIASVLAASVGTTAADMACLQTDTVSLQAAGILAALVVPHRQALESEPARRAADLLLGWDCGMRADQAAPTLFHLFYQQLLQRCFQPVLEAEVPGSFREYLSILHLAVPAMDALLLEADPVWFPGGVRATVEACLRAAWDEAEARLGPEASEWRWGTLHQLTFHHGLGRSSQWAARLLVRLLRLDRGPFAQAGDGMTVSMAGFSLAQPFAAVAGPSYRQIIDLGDPERSRWIVAGGASGDPRSPHYADQVPLWLAGEYREMRMEPEAMRNTEQEKIGMTCRAGERMI